MRQEDESFYGRLSLRSFSRGWSTSCIPTYTDVAGNALPTLALTNGIGLGMAGAIAHVVKS